MLPPDSSAEKSPFQGTVSFHRRHPSTEEPKNPAKAGKDKEKRERNLRGRKASFYLNYPTYSGIVNPIFCPAPKAGAKEAVAFLAEFLSAGFREAVILRTTRNERTKDERVLAAEVFARR